LFALTRQEIGKGVAAAPRVSASLFRPRGRPPLQGPRRIHKRYSWAGRILPAADRLFGSTRAHKNFVFVGGGASQFRRAWGLKVAVYQFPGVGARPREEGPFAGNPRRLSYQSRGGGAGTAQAGRVPSDGGGTWARGGRVFLARVPGKNSARPSESGVIVCPARGGPLATLEDDRAPRVLLWGGARGRAPRNRGPRHNQGTRRPLRGREKGFGWVGRLEVILDSTRGGRRRGPGHTPISRAENTDLSAARRGGTHSMWVGKKGHSPFCPRGGAQGRRGSTPGRAGGAADGRRGRSLGAFAPVRRNRLMIHRGVLHSLDPRHRAGGGAARGYCPADVSRNAGAAGRGRLHKRCRKKPCYFVRPSERTPRQLGPRGLGTWGMGGGGGGGAGPRAAGRRGSGRGPSEPG